MNTDEYNKELITVLQFLQEKHQEFIKELLQPQPEKKTTTKNKKTSKSTIKGKKQEKKEE